MGEEQKKKWKMKNEKKTKSIIFFSTPPSQPHSQVFATTNKSSWLSRGIFVQVTIQNFLGFLGFHPIQRDSPRIDPSVRKTQRKWRSRASWKILCPRIRFCWPNFGQFWKEELRFACFFCRFCWDCTLSNSSFWPVLWGDLLHEFPIFWRY